jgi:mono/diheme cytochrome c family protein
MAFQTNGYCQRLVLISLISFLVFLCSCSGGETNVSEKKSEPITDPALVQRLYIGKCGICHGPDGSMQNAGAKDLTTSTLSREDVMNRILYGYGTMPPQKGILSPEQVEALTDYAIALRVAK